MAFHVRGVQNAMQDHQHFDDLSDRPTALLSINNTGVHVAALGESEESASIEKTTRACSTA